MNIIIIIIIMDVTPSEKAFTTGHDSGTRACLVSSEQKKDGAKNSATVRARARHDAHLEGDGGEDQDE